ncbi:MAG: sugar transferase [Mycobacteriales bacterium]
MTRLREHASARARLVTIPRQRRRPTAALPGEAVPGPQAPDGTAARRTGRTWPRLGSYLLAGDLTAVGLTLLVRGGSGADVGAALLVPLVYRHLRLYRSRLVLSLLDDLPGLLLGGLVALAVSSAVARAVGAEDVTRSTVLALGLLVLVRGCAYAGARHARRRGLASYRTLVVGAGLLGGQLVEALRQHPEYGLVPVAFLDEAPSPPGSRTDLPVVDSARHLAASIEQLGIDAVVVAFGLADEADLVSLLRTCDRLDCETFLVPRLYELGCSERDRELVWGIPLVRLRPSALRPGARRAKRAFDVVVSATALVLLSPLLAVLALAVRRDGGPGVIFTQERVGVDGLPFRLLKFRSLTPVDASESASRWSVSEEPRMTRLGRFLRRSSLDELPQLWNVLRGDMSLVGPRPERPFFVEQFSASYPHYMARHRMPAGVTGWAQVHGLRGDTSISDRALMDNAYIESWSVWMDCKVLARTAGQVLRRSGG